MYGKSGVFDAERLIDLLMALEDFQVGGGGYSHGQTRSTATKPDIPDPSHQL